MSDSRIRKLLLYQKYITFCLERELRLSGGSPGPTSNKGAIKREVDKKAEPILHTGSMEVSHE